MINGPFQKKYDIAVLGGGMCGAGAALALAERGKSVLLVERRAFLGWEVVSAFHCEFNKSDIPMAEKIRKRLRAIKGLRADKRTGRVDIPFMEALLDKLAVEANVDILLFSQPTQILAEGNKVTGVILGSKGCEQLIQADAYIDATEEGVLWRQSGLEGKRNEAVSCLQTVFFNFVYQINDILLPLNLGDFEEIRNIRLYPSVRNTEVCVEFEMPEYSIAESRFAYDKVISYIKGRIPQLQEAAISHVGLEPFPLDSFIGFGEGGIKHPVYKNLFAAGIWTLSDPKERARNNSIEGRIGIGENTAKAILDIWEEIKAVPQPYSIPSLEIKTEEADVVIAGGGTAGSMAAISAGRQGARVILLEAGTFLGGMGTVSEHYVGHGVPGGLQEEFHDRTRSRQVAYNGKHIEMRIHPEAAKAVLEEMCREAGVRIVYAATAVGVEMKGTRLEAIIAATPEGKTRFVAKTFIDSTGDADVAFMAGTPARTGRDIDGVFHCYSQCGRLMFDEHPITGIRATNIDAGYVDSFDVVDMTRARREGVRQIAERWEKGFNDERQLLAYAPLVGIRQGRLIIGDYEKDMIEQILPVHYYDCIGYECGKYDCHSQDYENQQDLPILWVWMLGNRERGIGGETPYRCMLPKAVEGLLVACRSASTTNEANYEFRVMRNMKRIGEAAGIAAALCARMDTTPRGLDVKLVQKELYKSGALEDNVRPKPVVTKYSLDELKAILSSRDPKDAVWLLAQGAEKEVTLLKDFVRNGPEESRFWAAVALAWHKDEAALPELIECVRERMSDRFGYTPSSKNMVPLWQSAIIMLGRIGRPEAVPVLVEVLKDESVDMDVIISVVRALGRIGDDSVVSLLLELVEREDLPRKRLFQMTSIWGKWPHGEDGLWQIELALAEVLANFGRPQPHIVGKYIKDSRKHVRRYAEMVGGRPHRHQP